MGYFRFNNISSEDFHIRIASPPDYVIPNKNYIFTHIPGRNGDLVFDQGDYANTQKQYQISFPLEEYVLSHPALTCREAFLKLSNDIATWLFSGSGYFELSDSYEPNHYRIATINPEGLTLTNYLDQVGAGAITFNCKPERYLNSGKTVKSYSASSTKPTITSTFVNPTSFDSYPLLRVKKVVSNPKDAVSFAINSTTDFINVTGLDNGNIVLDCEKQEAYYELSGANANSKVTLPKGFPVLNPGNNTITLTWANACTVDITPRWWTL